MTEPVVENVEEVELKRKNLKDSSIASTFKLFKKVLKRDKMAMFGVVVLIFFILVAVFAPLIAPYDPYEMNRTEDGAIARLQPPSAQHWFGTTNLGRDVFSQVVMGSRVALLVGFLAAFLVTFIGTNVGLIAGYYGGAIDNFLMRIVDIMYALPFIPFVIILVALLDPSIWNIILAISLLTWRTVARIIRSQVLSVVNRPFIKAAKVAGASDLRIMYKYITPNIIPLALLEMAFMVSWAILAEASVSFIGFGDPDVISWGQILHTSFLTGAIRTAWWWVIPPGVAIVLVLVAIFFTARAFEEIVNPRLRRR
ncbi:ABC transporter permease [Natroniella sp. ANB-PHB2]|uniref:ABC transporter permease n=1 Tax=Natroniella sp. ANB-PHB2 TaxID=3384444 RepID=UPI0038D47657